MTWPSSDLDDDNDLRNLSEHGYGETQTMRRQRFLEKLPNRERFVISSLLNWMNRLVELETVLMDSRRKIVSEEKLTKISEYINKEERRDRECKLYGRSGDMDSCLLDLSLVIQSNEALERLKEFIKQHTLRVPPDAQKDFLFYRKEHLYRVQIILICIKITNCKIIRKRCIVRSAWWNMEYLRREVLFYFFRENGRHRRIFELVDRRCRQMVRIINQVIFSDDTKSNLDDPDGCNFYWRGLHNDFRHFNPKFLRRKCYDLERVQRYGTSRLGVCIDEDEQQGVPGCLRTSSRHDFPSFPIVSSTFQQNNAITDASRRIAVIELRLVNVRGELATMTEGRLNNSSHLNLTPSMPDLRMRRAMYRDMTHTVCYEMPEDIPVCSGVCAYAQAVIWQSGDVGLNELENLLRMIVTQVTF
uniref:Uncharacterized protein n=1 Tax=Heterorhabditis bacteriophora TaxID=37862 RepID=A0A1I7X9V3_HETBA